MLAGGILTLSLILLAKPTATRSFVPASLAVMTALSFCFVGVHLEPGTALVPSAVSSAVMGMGIVWQMYAKLRLGRCFSILPACRSIVVGRFSAFHPAACAVYYAVKLCRIHDEEHLLSAQRAAAAIRLKYNTA